MSNKIKARQCISLIQLSTSRSPVKYVYTHTKLSPFTDAKVK